MPIHSALSLVKKLILKCGFCPGDIVMLTAAVRDLHRNYPNRFLTDVRTCCDELWLINPFITALSDEDPDAEDIECTYPLINRCNEAPYHCLHGFIEFLNHRLGLAIKPTAFCGDIRLSAQEKSWYSQVHELTRRDIPFWIIAAGGKYDITIKWWDPARYQAVVDHFRGRVQFVQVGDTGHHHPRLNGVIDLRGKTSLRQLVRLVYHAQGVLCPVTSLMHLAAAVETKPGQPPCRPCVVVAGAREPAHWEAYPGHQFIHTNGALPCGLKGGCWRDRVEPLRDGDKRDHPERLCLDVSNGLPHCMDLITAAEVIGRIELYFQGGALPFLARRQHQAAECAVRATARNRYDRQKLNLRSAGLACDAFIRTLDRYPGGFIGRGIVICGGGVRYFTSAWVGINMLRRQGCRLPIEVWYLGPNELDAPMAALLKPLGVRCVDALAVRKRHPVRILKGWELKPYAIIHSSFQQVLLLDADNLAVSDPEFLFDTPEFKDSGAIFWPDFVRGTDRKARSIWRSCRLRQPHEPEFETGQILVDKERCWPALVLTMWFNENSDFYYNYIHGDKETFHLAFRKLNQPFSLVPKPIHPLQATMCQHDFPGRRIFQHRNMDKWDLFLHNRKVKDFWFEKECREFILELRRRWDGRLASATQRCTAHRRQAAQAGRFFPTGRNGSELKINAVMISCDKRAALRERTLNNLARTDWDHAPVHVQMDPGSGNNLQRRQTRCARLALEQALETPADYILFLEDDLDFNRHLYHNLQAWPALRTGTVAVASLYNPTLREVACDVRNNARLIAPTSVFGSQAFLISRAAARYILRHWHSVAGMQDIKISRLGGRLRGPLYYHVPSLVQHIGRPSLWGGAFHSARDFDPDWQA